MQQLTEQTIQALTCLVTTPIAAELTCSALPFHIETATCETTKGMQVITATPGLTVEQTTYPVTIELTATGVSMSTTYKKMGAAFAQLTFDCAFEDETTIYFVKSATKLAGHGAITRLNKDLKTDREAKLKRRQQLIVELGAEVLTVKKHDWLVVSAIAKAELETACTSVQHALITDLCRYAAAVEKVLAPEAVQQLEQQAHFSALEQLVQTQAETIAQLESEKQVFVQMQQRLEAEIQALEAELLQRPVAEQTTESKQGVLAKLIGRLRNETTE